MPAFLGMPGRTCISNQTSAAIGPSGKPIRVFGAWAVSDGTATTVKLYNNTSASGSDYVQIDGVISKSASLNINLDSGLIFPLGCWAVVDAHTVTLVVSYEVEI
jgi:hypothetical protein